MNMSNDTIDYFHSLTEWENKDMDSEALEELINELECIDNSEYKDYNMSEFLNEVYQRL